VRNEVNFKFSRNANNIFLNYYMRIENVIFIVREEKAIIFILLFLKET
jgi:hypothetical protein